MTSNYWNLTLVTLAIVAVVLARAGWSKVKLLMLRESGSVAQGVIIEVIRDSVGGDHPDIFVVSYRFPAGESGSVTSSEQLLNPRKVPSVGDTVVVRYDPKAPQNARIDSSPQ